jgi:hypothetical protein
MERNCKRDGEAAACLTRAIHKRYIQSSLKAALKGAVLP